jgi:hypothetical protein
LTEPLHDDRFAGLNDLTTMAITRLRRAVGKAAADVRAQEVLSSLGLIQLRTADDLLSFANGLLKYGGPTEMVGNALKVSAILRGGRER